MSRAQNLLLPVSALEVCDRARVRHQKPKDGSDIVLEYAEAYECGLIIEPLDVFRERGTDRYIVADGEHRLLALRRTKIKKIDCRLHEGDEIDALDFAIQCNQKHGLRRTDRDKYHALARIKETPRLAEKYRTDSELSAKIGVSVRTIKRYMAQWRDSDGGDETVRAEKQKAQVRAEKYHPDANGNMTRVMFNPGQAATDPDPRRLISEPDSGGGSMTRVMLQTGRNTSPQEANGSREPFQASDSPKEIPVRPRSEASNLPLQTVQHPEQHKPVPVHETNGHAGSDAALIVDFTDALFLFGELPPAAEFRGLLNGQLNWDHVERAHQWLTDLLGER